MFIGRKQVGFLVVLAVIGLIVGCAFDLADVKYRPALLESAANEETFTLAADIPIQGAPCNFSRSLRKGSRWFAVGKLAEGIVYRSRDQVLTVECSNVFEAYLVVTAERLVGFYLPVEKGFSPLSKPIQLVFSR